MLLNAIANPLYLLLLVWLVCATIVWPLLIVTRLGRIARAVTLLQQVQAPETFAWQEKAARAEPKFRRT